MSLRVNETDLLRGLREPLLVESVHEHYLVVYQRCSDGGAGGEEVIARWGSHTPQTTE